MTSHSIITRRAALVAIARAFAGAGVLGALAAIRPRAAAAAAAAAPRRIVVYKDAGCGCCKEWVLHLRRSGFAPEAHDRTDMDTLKDSLGVPSALRSCHTAVAGRYLIEGHVPAEDIKRLLAAAPNGVAGLAVPGMPTGAPGMEMPGRRADRYQVIAFTAAGGTSVFATHA